MASKWKPANIDTFIQDYLAGQSCTELAIKYNGSVDQVKRLLSYLRQSENLPSMKEIKEGIAFIYKASADREKFCKLLIKAHTASELEYMFGEKTEELLNDTYEGLQLFTQINNYGEIVYILLPKMDDSVIKVKPRNWKYHHSFTETMDATIKQPYQLVQLPETAFKDDKIIIAPIADVHLGHFAHKREKFLSYIRWIQENDNIYAFILGDLTENAIENGKGMTYSQNKSPYAQIDESCKLLAPIAHKLLFIQPGNHERRTYKVAGVDPTAIIANRLDIPYFSGPVYMSIMCNNHKWKLYAFHGNTSSQTKGGKMNAAGKPRTFTDFVNFYISAHVHDPLVNNETCIVEDPLNCKLKYETQWTVICPSFMRWEETYAYEWNCPPPGKGGVTLNLYSNGDYEAVLRDRQ